MSDPKCLGSLEEKADCRKAEAFDLLAVADGHGVSHDRKKCAVDVARVGLA